MLGESNERKGYVTMIYKRVGMRRCQTRGSEKENGERNVPEDHFLVFTLGQEI